MLQDEIDAILNGEPEAPAGQPDAKPEESPEGDPKELAERAAVAEKRYKDLQAEYNRRDEEIRRLRKLEESKAGRGDDDTPDVNVQNADYLKRLGFVSREDLDTEIERRISDRDKAREVVAGAREVAKEYPFVSFKDIIEDIKKVPGLSPLQAAKLRYEKEFDILKAKGTVEVPETDKGGKAIEDVPKPKRVTFGDRKSTSQAIAETLSSAGFIN